METTLQEVLQVETIQHCEVAVRIIAREGEEVRSVSFVPTGHGEEGFCKMSRYERRHKEDSAFFSLTKCLSPPIPGRKFNQDSRQ